MNTNRIGSIYSIFNLPSSSNYDVGKEGKLVLRTIEYNQLTPQPQYKFDHPFALKNCSLVKARTPPIKSLYIKLNKNIIECS